MRFCGRTIRDVFSAWVPLAVCWLLAVALGHAQQPQTESNQNQPNRDTPVVVSDAPNVTIQKPQPAAEPKSAQQQSFGVNLGSVSDWVMVAVTCALLYVGTQQWRTYKRQAAIMIEQARHMRDGLEETRKATKATTDAVLMTHRPKIIVREIDIPATLTMFKVGYPTNDPDEIQRILEHDLPSARTLWGKFRITNKGNNSATIILIEAVIHIGAFLPVPNPCYGQELTLPSQKLVGGATVLIDFAPLAITSEETTRVRNGKLHIFALGKIVYIDDLGNGRRTGFAREFHMETGRFRVVKDEPDYDYVD